MGSAAQVDLFDQNLSYYVTGAIERAGLPVDPSINWAKWLDSVYRPALPPLTSDVDLIDDAIREILVQRLYQERILEKNSPYSHFDENHASKNLEKEVSAYLADTFKKAVPEALDFVREALSIGTGGALSRQPGGLPLQMASFSGVKSKAKKSKAEPVPVPRLNVSRKQAAFMLGVCEGTIDNYRRNGRLKVTTRVGGS